jgi:glycosyltransferase involved in cell wall biosynthesis
MSQSANDTSPNYDLICFSHLRWNFVFQRPQHLLSRCAKTRRVFYVEEPVATTGPAYLAVSLDQATNVHVAVPHLPDGLSDDERESEQARLVVQMCADYAIADHVEWFYTPMALPIAASLTPRARVYDCMDELSAFLNAPKQLLTREAELLNLADVVFTGGHALYEAKKHRHGNIHPFPSSVDKAHFGRARSRPEEPEDQRRISGPKLGFFGVIDERMDLNLLESVARSRPEWQLVLLGPVVKVDPADLPRLPNLHYLGSKAYAELPDYISGWDVALLPFAKNEATRFISPTKTPEYLAAGKPVVSTSIRDVVRPYSVQGLARIADTPSDFVAACEAAMSEPSDKLIRRADAFLAKMSWDKTWDDMQELVDRAALPSSHRISGTQRYGVFRDADRDVG